MAVGIILFLFLISLTPLYCASDLVNEQPENTINKHIILRIPLISNVEAVCQFVNYDTLFGNVHRINVFRGKVTIYPINPLRQTKHISGFYTLSLLIGDITTNGNNETYPYKFSGIAIGFGSWGE